MDANLWKLLVDKVIRKTKSRDLLWSATSHGPAKTLSFGTSIDDNTTLNIWGYETNYSYELCLTKQTAGEPFEERKRVTTKKGAEGIEFSGLFKTAQSQVADVIRERACDAIMESLANPPVADSKEEDDICDRLEAFGDKHYFYYSQDEKVLALVRDLTVAGSIPWEYTKDDEEGEYFSADIARFGPYLSLRATRTSPKAVSRRYSFGIMHEGSFNADVEIEPTKAVTRNLCLIADDIYAIVSKMVRDDEAEFEKIVSGNIINDIFSSLDNLGK